MWTYKILLSLIFLSRGMAMYASPPRRELVSVNHFSSLPVLTPTQKQVKCQLKMNFACACKDASTAYEIATKEADKYTHPFCESNPTHRWCIGACKDASGTAIAEYPKKAIQTKVKLGKDADGVEEKTVDSLVDCHEQAKLAGKDYYEFDSVSKACRIATTQGTYLTIQAFDSTSTMYHRTDSVTGCKLVAAANTFHEGNLNPDRSYSMKLRGQVIDLGKKLSSGTTVAAATTEEACKAAAETAESLYYSFRVGGDCIHGNDYTLVADDPAANARVYGRGVNELRMCLAKDRGEETLCDEHDPMCHSQPIINRLDTSSLNFDQILVHASYNKIGSITQCNYDGKTSGIYQDLDRELYPLAPCPDTDTAYYCDFPRNEKFGSLAEVTDFKADGSTDFKCAPDVTVHFFDKKATGGTSNTIQSTEVSAAACQAKAKQQKVEYFSYQANEYECQKNGTACTALTCTVATFVNKLECEQVHDRTWTAVHKGECIIVNGTLTTTAQTGANVHRIHTRESTGLPDGIREYDNGYDKQAVQFSYETQDPVSASQAVNNINTNQESISMNIFTVGRLIKDKLILSAQSEGSDDGTTNSANAQKIMNFFTQLAKTGDAEAFSTSTAAQPASAEWFPTKVGTNDDGVNDKFRCHSVADTTIDQFRNFTDVRTEFIDKFFEAADAAVDQCTDLEDNTKYDIAKLDDDRETIPDADQFKRCRNNALSENILYPSLRKAFYNPITSDGYRSGFMKGQRFIKEYGRSKTAVGSVSDGTTTETYNHDKFMVNFNTEQLEQCNTEMPDKSGYLMLQKRAYPDSPTDDIMGKWGNGYDKDNYQQWGLRFCRTAISITKLGKNPDTVLFQKYKSDSTGKYLEKYSYRIEITEEDCSDMNIQEEEPIAQGTTAPFSIQETEEVVRITPAAQPDWCRTETGQYEAKQMDYSDGGVCLSHKQEPRKTDISEDTPYGDLGYSVHAKCVEDASGIDVISVYTTKSSCQAKPGHTWVDSRGYFKEDSGNCYVDATGALVESKEVCIIAGVVSTDASLNDTASCAAAQNTTGEWINPTGSEANCKKATAHKWEVKMVSFGYVASVTNATGQDNDELVWEDSRLSCASMGTSYGRSKYDRIRLAFFVDVLMGKDLFDEGRVNAGILPRGIPTGITEGAGTSTSVDDCAECVKEHVGQHMLSADDHDDNRENVTDPEYQNRKQRFEDGYRAVGYGKDPTTTYERVPPANRQGRQDHNTLVQIVNRYVVRDVGTDAAGTGTKPFIDDALTTISYLGTATTSMTPLLDTTQTLMEDEGDGKLYNRYLVEMFSADCLDRTQKHTHSAQFEVQLFKDGRWPADRLSDAQQSCDGTGLDTSTKKALTDASPTLDAVSEISLDTKQVCGPIETTTNHTNEGNLCLPVGSNIDKVALIFKVEQSNANTCGGASLPSTTASDADDIQDCAAWAHSGGYNRIVFEQGVQCTACAVGDAGAGTGTAHMKISVSGRVEIPACVNASVGHYCQLCSAETFGCEALAPAKRLIDMQCAGRNFHDKQARLGLNAKKPSLEGPEDNSNLQIVDIPAIEQTDGSFYGAELIEFSVGVSLLDTIEFEEDQYVTLKGMDSRIEMVAWVRNTELGNAASAKDVRSMGDLVYPQVSTEEIVITAQSFDREQDLASWDINIEGVSVCAHAHEDLLNSYVSANTLTQEVVDCISKGTDCQKVMDSCPQRTDTGFNLKKEGDNFFLLAEFRSIFGNTGHLFVDETCDMLSVTKLLDMLSFPDYGTTVNTAVYALSKKKVGQEAVDNACVKPGAPTSDKFYKMLGPQNSQAPASQTIVRNFKALLMSEARGASPKRGLREVVPCRRLATHGDDMSFQFRNAVLKGYTHADAYSNLSTFGSRFEPRDCFLDHYTDTNGTTVKNHATDTESCMTNVLSHLASETSFEEYLNSIGGSDDFDNAVCVQKNNIWRQGAAGEGKRSFSKHIPCGYSRAGLFNFDYDSVQTPAFNLTAEEQAYRLSPSSSSWDAIVYHPDDIGDLSHHYEPSTEDFQLQLKVEVIVHGSTCTADFDPKSNRRRLLSFTERKRIRGPSRKLLQLASGEGVTPDARFGGGSSITFNINVNLAAAAATQSQVIGMDKQGEETIVTNAEKVKESLGLEETATETEVRKEIYKNVKKMVKESSACLHKLSFQWVTLSFIGYYVLSLLIAALLAACAPDLLTGKSMSVFFDPRD
jgi:hypothetical protein